MPIGCCYELSMTYAPWMMIFPYPKFEMRKTDLGSISLYITFPTIHDNSRSKGNHFANGKKRTTEHILFD